MGDGEERGQCPRQALSEIRLQCSGIEMTRLPTGTALVYLVPFPLT